MWGWLLAEVLRDEVMFRGRRVSLIKRFVRIKDKVVTREVVSFGEAVAMVPLLPDGSVVLIRQFRSPIKKWIYEIPAGKVEPSEDPLETVRRELVEEIGYEVDSIEHLVSVHTTPGYSDEVLHIFLVKCSKEVGARPEPYELIERVKVPLDRAIELVLSEDVVDAKTLLALLMLKYGVRKEKR